MHICHIVKRNYIVRRSTNMGQRRLSGIVDLGKEEMIEIYNMAMGE
ncbi:hypothetical protein GPL26_25475 [Enterocloster citroniae]|uniref:Uncharacterized protein n=1 Tax=Enterocloster citroniae TaxID=358743 RepID=A0AA41FK87_9FIRM|nr:hypothetical protein [Enterocloster citroniae]MBT9812929.1 hypothetical protein [Enterocloster citroniae]